MQLDKQCARIDFLISSANPLAMTWVHNQWKIRGQSPPNRRVYRLILWTRRVGRVFCFLKKNFLTLPTSR